MTTFYLVGTLEIIITVRPYYHFWIPHESLWLNGLLLTNRQSYLGTLILDR